MECRLDNYTCRKVAWLALVALTVSSGVNAQNPDARRWPVHSTDRPRPPVIQPGPAGPLVPPPSDAVLLFDGRDLAGWSRQDGSPARWTVSDGSVEIAPGTGDIISRRSFGDMQLHIEWAAPAVVRGEGQGRGNSGIFLGRYYELQVLDSYRNDTYADGQAGAMYGQTPPLVNAMRPPGEWNTFDVVFHRPRFNADGSLARPARLAAWHNGVLIHDNTEFTGRTVHMREAEYSPHPDRQPILLQDHGDRVRYRSIWVRELE